MGYNHKTKDNDNNDDDKDDDDDDLVTWNCVNCS